MNKIDKLFKDKNENILSVFFTAGYPGYADTGKILESLEKNGADMVEIGIPFSDPVADGPVIQESSKIALRNGITLKAIFDQLAEAKGSRNIPTILMGYFNPVLQYGIEKFCRQCKGTGIDGVIIPDLPVHEYRGKYKKLFEEHGIHFILLVTPHTNDERMSEIGTESNGFIYAVSSHSTTGGRSNILEQKEYFQRVRKITGKPVLVGFGVSDRESFNDACSLANGAIIGSAFIKALSGGGNTNRIIREFIRKIKP